MSAVRDIQGKIEIHQDRAKAAVRNAKAYMAARDYDKAITSLIDANFHESMVNELKSVKP